jgi:glycosyltransferase involved in cell wall biosynthesis
MNTAPIEVSVIIPCLNEAANAACFETTLLEPLERSGFENEVIFSDGGSSDGTVEIIQKLCTKRPRMRLLTPEGRSSFGDSMERAVAASKGEYIVFLEADLSFSPADIVKLLTAAKSGGLDCVCGSPFLGNFEGIAFIRKTLTYCANLLLRMRFGRSITSYTQIFKLYRASTLKGLDFESAGFALDAELMAKHIALGLKIGEVPVIMRGRRLDRSKMSAASEIANYLTLIVKGAQVRIE